MKYRWIGTVPADEVVCELKHLLHTDDVGAIREIVFKIYHPNIHESVVFACMECVSKKMSINNYGALSRLVPKLCEWILKEYEIKESK